MNLLQRLMQGEWLKQFTLGEWLVLFTFAAIMLAVLLSDGGKNDDDY